MIWKKCLWCLIRIKTASSLNRNSKKDYSCLENKWLKKMWKNFYSKLTLMEMGSSVMKNSLNWWNLNDSSFNRKIYKIRYSLKKVDYACWLFYKCFMNIKNRNSEERVSNKSQIELSWKIHPHLPNIYCHRLSPKQIEGHYLDISDDQLELEISFIEGRINNKHPSLCCVYHFDAI